MPSTTTPQHSLKHEDISEFAEFFGFFRGSNLTDEELDVLVGLRVNRDAFKESGLLYKTKWWDYRNISPGRSVCLFIYYFNVNYQNIMKNRSRTGRSGVFAGKEAGNIWDYPKMHWTAFTKAANMADALGIDYKFYTYHALIDIVECLHKDRQKGNKPISPQPNHLYAEYRVERVFKAWKEKTSKNTILSSNPYYDADNYKGFDAQNSYLKYLHKIVNASGHKAATLYNLIYIRKQITEEYAIKHFGEENVMGAKVMSLA